MSTADYILKLFKGRHDYLAVPNGKGFQPQQIRRQLTSSWFEREHLSGKQCFGFYLLDADSKCWCSAVDFDNKEDSPDPEWQTKTEQVYYELTGYGMTPLIEISQSGHAAHVWLFFETAIDAWIVRKFWDAVSKSSAVPFVEVYPRQDRLSGKQLGNLIRYPLYNQSRFVDVEHDWQTIEPLAALQSVRTVDDVTLRTLIFQVTGSAAQEPKTGISETGLPVRVDKLISREHTLLGRRWRGDMEGMNDHSRSALVLSIVCELVRLYVPTPEIEQAIKVWCDNNGYDKGEREDWISATVGKAYEFICGRDAERIGTSWTMLDAVLEYIGTIGTESRYVSTGITELDNSIDGVSPGEMAVIAARPSQGKTAFGLHWIDAAALNQIPCLIVSEEMSKLELAKRALLAISKLDSDKWEVSKTPRLESEARSHYGQRAPVYGVESCQTIDALEQAVAMHVEVKGVRLVAVDYLQLLSSEHNVSRYEAVTDISKRLKQIAVKYRVAMLVMCQLNREIEKREQKSPLLSDLRESGQIEQDADLVLFLQWPFRMSNKEANEKRYLIWCAKRRNGPVRVPCVETEFDCERQKFGRYETDVDCELDPQDYADRYGGGR